VWIWKRLHLEIDAAYHHCVHGPWRRYWRSGPRVVLLLPDEGLIRQRLLHFTDNFYSSPALFQQLLFQCKTDAVGTVRTGRKKNMPADLKKPIARGSTLAGSSSKAADEPTASHWQALPELQFIYHRMKWKQSRQGDAVSAVQALDQTERSCIKRLATSVEAVTLRCARRRALNSFTRRAATNYCYSERVNSDGLIR